MSDEPSAHQMAPEQRDITYGGYWILPVNPAKHFTYIGYVPTLEQVGERAEASGFDPTVAQDQHESMILRNLLPSHVRSRLNTDGMFEILHRAQVWPIYPDLFASMERANWDYRNLLSSYDKQRYSLAVEQWTAWRDRPKPIHRSFEEFVSEVEEIAEQATAHNEGQTYYGYNRIGDRAVVLRMSSWPRAMEASRALADHGFDITFSGDALSVTDRVVR